MPVKSGIAIGLGPLLTTMSTAVVAAQRGPRDRVAGDDAALGHLLVVALDLVAVGQLGVVEHLLRVVEGAATDVGDRVPLRARESTAPTVPSLATRSPGAGSVETTKPLRTVSENAVPVTRMSSPAWSSSVCAAVRLMSMTPGVTV